MKENKYTISEAARLLSVENHVLRYWEEELELNIPRNELDTAITAKRKYSYYTVLKN